MQINEDVVTPATIMNENQSRNSSLNRKSLQTEITPNIIRKTSDNTIFKIHAIITQNNKNQSSLGNSEPIDIMSV